jgi:hypothetical protein
LTPRSTTAACGYGSWLFRQDDVKVVASKKKGPAFRRDLPLKLYVRKLAAGVLLLLARLLAALLAAALLLPGLLARILILLTRLRLARLVLVLAGHFKYLLG